MTGTSSEGNEASRIAGSRHLPGMTGLCRIWGMGGIDTICLTSQISFDTKGNGAEMV